MKKWLLVLGIAGAAWMGLVEYVGSLHLATISNYLGYWLARKCVRYGGIAPSLWTLWLFNGVLVITSALQWVALGLAAVAIRQQFSKRTPNNGQTSSTSTDPETAGGTARETAGETTGETTGETARETTGETGETTGTEQRNRDAMEREKMDQPVWTLEFIRVNLGFGGFGGAMTYLDDNWLRVRAEAKKEGTVLDYHRIHNAALEIDGHKVGDPHSFVLMTEYKNLDAFMQSKTLFASIRERLPNTDPGVLNPEGLKPEDIYEIVDSQVFLEEPEVSGGFKLLTQK